MFQLLHSASLWAKVSKVRGDKSVIAAIAYANKDHLKLRAKDILICDASDPRISSGATTYDLLAALAKRKVELWHLDKLHAKVVRLSSHVVVGSANMTANSESLFEVAFLTDQAEALKQVDDLLSDLLSSGKLQRIDEAFLARIKEIPVVRSGGGRQAQRSLKERTPTSWIMAYRDLSDREQEKSDPIVQVMTGEDEAPAYYRTTLKAAEKRPLVQLGDHLIFVHLDEKCVWRPVKVTGVVQCGNHLFYIHEDVQDGDVAWKLVQKELSYVGQYRRQGIPVQLALNEQGAAIVRGLFSRRLRAG